MLFKTHLAINFFFALFFSNYIQHKTIFIALVLFATAFPDIDNLNSYISKKARTLSKIVHFFFKHRDFFHSITFVVLLSFLLMFLSANIAFPFFIGYTFHILADSFTVEGIRIFWPLKTRTKGKIRTNGLIEKIIFYAFILLDILYLAYIF